MTLGAALAASLLATLARPATWVLALLGFLVRGGFVVALLPIVVLPSAVGLANVIAPTLTSMVFGGLSGTVVALIVGTMVAVALWLGVGGLLAAAVEADGIRRVAVDEEVAAIAPSVATLDADALRPGVAGRILLVRMVAALPLAVALGLGALRVVAVAYRELTVPSDVEVSSAIRILRGAPEAIAAIGLAWVVAEVVGGLAARRVVLAGEGPARATWQAIEHALRHPLRTAIAFAVPLAALVAVIVPSAAAASVTWDGIRGALADGGNPLAVVGLLLAFVGLWSGGLVLIGMACAWRSAVWTVEVARTFGAVPTALPGEWTDLVDAATLQDLRSPGADPDPR